MESGRKLAVIVEDDPDVRNLLRTVLTQSGFETVLTGNGEDGVAAVRMHDPVLTTLDVSMPGMDGHAAAAAIREFSDTYIIMITAQDDEIDVISGLNAGADEYLSKPFRPRELRARIASLLRRPRGSIVPESGDSADTPGDGLWRRPTESAFEQPAPPPPLPPVPQPVQPLPPQPPVVEQPYQQPAAQPYQQPSYPPAPPAYPSAPQPQAQPEVPPAYVPPQQSQPAAPHVAPAAGQPLSGGSGLYSHAGLVLDTTTGYVTADGQPVALTPEEFGLLRTLMSSGRRVRSKADLVLAARGESYVTSYFVTEHDKRVIDQQVASLRYKLRDEAPMGRWIETVDGVGYRMAA